jgi:hypothetical protein
MNKKSIAVATMVLLLGIGGPMRRAHAQGNSSPKAAPVGTVQAGHSYRLDYTLTESDEGKKIDTRQYALELGPWHDNQRSSGRIQIGTRIPASTKTDGTTQYLDVGTTITGNLSLADGAMTLDSYCEVTSVAPGQDNNGTGRPVLRTLTISNNTPVTQGKPMLVGIAEDPTSNHRFQLDVTVTELN